MADDERARIDDLLRTCILAGCAVSPLVVQALVISVTQLAGLVVELMGLLHTTGGLATLGEERVIELTARIYEVQFCGLRAPVRVV